MKLKFTDLFARAHNFAAFAVILPFICGCNGGGGSSAAVGSLFSSSQGTTLADASGAGAAGLTTLHNPEPATMALLGGGMLMMGYLKSRSNFLRK